MFKYNHSKNDNYNFFHVLALFFLVRYQVEPGQEISNVLFDITLSKIVFLNTTTFRLRLKVHNIQLLTCNSHNNYINKNYFILNQWH